MASEPRARSTPLLIRVHTLDADGRARITAEIPNLSLEDVKAVLGEELAAAAKNTPKQFTVQVSDVSGSTPVSTS